jgi:hypothetical protein
MIKVADIYVSEDGCGPYTITVCGGVDAIHFKVIGKSLYFDEDKFSTSISSTTTSSTTTNPNLINMFFTSGPNDTYVYNVTPNFSFGNLRISVFESGQPVSNPALSYQWQEQINGVWINIPNSISSSLSNYTKYNYVRVLVTYKTKTIISRAVRGYLLGAVGRPLIRVRPVIR